METIYRLKASEIDMQLIDSIKQLFKDEEILLSVVSAHKHSGKTVKYASKLLDSVKNIEKGKVKTLSGLDFENLTEELLHK